MRKKGNQSSSLDEYIQKVNSFKGQIDTCATSIEIILDAILEKISSRPQNKTLGAKIEALRKSKSKLQTYTGNLDTLVDMLFEFNKVWITTKHGITVAKENIKNITIFKDNMVHEFDDKEIEDIKSEFTQIQTALTEILDKIV